MRCNQVKYSAKKEITKLKRKKEFGTNLDEVPQKGTVLL